MLTEKTEQLIEILPNGVIQVRNTRIIMDNGVEISRSYHRKVIDVEDDVSNESDRIQAIAPQIRTPQVIAGRKAEIAKNKVQN